MEQEYIILQIQEDDYGCEERSAGAKKTVKRSVISTQDAEKLEAVFVTEDRKESIDGPVHIKDELPVYLL